MGQRSRFQSAPPHGERRKVRSALDSAHKFQSAPPHGERRQPSARQICPVSIRAPARGATMPVSTATLAVVFQSAPPHGERRRQGAGRCSDSCFNPRPRTGSDCSKATACSASGGFNPRPRTGSDAAILQAFPLALWFQSAPPHGERRRALPQGVRACSFNPRPRTGSDRARRIHARVHRGFNPRPRTGSDASPSPPKLSTSCFNPRPRTGSDPPAPYVQLRYCVSIRAPARGATPPKRQVSGSPKFQSAPPHGERLASSVTRIPCQVFQSAPPHGERPGVKCKMLSDRRFNPRPRTGSDAADISYQRSRHVVSIRAPARGATTKARFPWS